jgi:hypothetical protein
MTAIDGRSKGQSSTRVRDETASAGPFLHRPLRLFHFSAQTSAEPVSRRITGGFVRSS